MAVGLGELGILVTICGYFINKYLGIYWAVAIFVGFFFWQIVRLQQRNLVWTQLGIAGPKPKLFVGNFIQLMSNGMHNADMEWTKSYGKIFGTYFFTQPDLVVSDLDLLKRIFVKDFHNFTNRRDTGAFADGDSILAKILTFIKDDEWKRVRNTVTPAFTSGKMKHMTQYLDNSIGTLLQIFAEKADRNESIDVKEKFSACVMDMIAATAFGVETDCQRNKDNLFMKYSNEVNTFKLTSFGFMFKVIFFPWFAQQLNKYFGVRFLFKEPEEFYTKTLTQIMDSRRVKPLTDKPDFLQLMLNAAVSNDVDEDKDEALSHDLGTQRTPLTRKQIMSQSFLFLVAGYDTTATTLSWIAYLLAVHPKVQDACYDEIVSTVGNNNPITYNHIQHELPYLDAVVSETLRLYPPAVRTDRHCSDEYQLDGYTVPKNSTITIPIYVIHHDEQNYPDPERFLPERFMPEEKMKRDPLTFLPFGYGPRNCIGMRFAQMTIKLIIANLIRKYIICPSDTTEAYPPKLGKENLLKPLNPIMLKVKTRV